MTVQVQRVRVDSYRAPDALGTGGAENRGRRGFADFVAVEQPLEIRVDGRPHAVTMRTPGHDIELAAGFCLGEGLVRTLGDIHRITSQAGSGEAGARWVDVRLAESALPRPPRATVTNSSCGLCGTESLELMAEPARLGQASARVRVDMAMLSTLPDRLAASQRVFGRTGGCHGAALATNDGEVLCVREDVGRHNAADKVIGWALRSGLLPLDRGILVLSGRVSYELVAKALAAGIPIVAAVSAPSSAAVDLARMRGMTLAAFVRDGGANVYSGDVRVVAGSTGTPHDGGAHGDG